MTWDGSHLTVLQILVNRVFATLPEQDAARPFKMSDEISALHLSGRLKYQVFFLYVLF